MSNSSWIKLWKEKNYEGDHTDKLYGNESYHLHDENKMKDAATSLKTGPNTWVKLHDLKNYNATDSETMWIGPNMLVSDLSSLIMTTDGSGGTTWNNRIGSLSVQNYAPTGYDFDCWIKLYTLTDCDESEKFLFLNGPADIGNLHDFNWMKDEACSLETGPNTWVILFNKKDQDYGSQLIVGPNTRIDDLSTLDQNSESGTWAKSIGSLKMYNTRLVDIDTVIANFWSLYGLTSSPTSTANASGKTAFIGSGNGTFGIKVPNFSVREDGNYEVTIETLLCLVPTDT